MAWPQARASCWLKARWRLSATFRAFLAGQFGEASKTVVFEEPLIGMELSLHVLVDVDAQHAAFAMLPACQDHKRIFEDDRGPNTGGMGAFGPLPFLRPEDIQRMRAELVEPTVHGLQKDGLAARGVLFLGVMWTAAGPKLLEYNVRFGDPETQVLMQLLDEDLAALLLEVAQGRLVSRDLKLKPHTAITVVLAAEGLPRRGEEGRAHPDRISGCHPHPRWNAEAGWAVAHERRPRDEPGHLGTRPRRGPGGHRGCLAPGPVARHAGAPRHRPQGPEACQGGEDRSGSLVTSCGCVGTMPQG